MGRRRRWPRGARQPGGAGGARYHDLSELRGRNGHDAVHYKRPDGSPYPRDECPVLEPLRTGEPVHCDEDWFVRRDGTMVPVSVTAAPIELPTGRGVVMTFVDTTVQREAERGLRERDAILAQVAQPVWVVNLEGRFHYANPDAAREQLTRDLAAGIHPAILTDRGLGAAVTALAWRASLPVSVSDGLRRRLQPPIEASLYFFVSEALTNAVKHASAGRAEVRLSVAGDRLTIEVSDDGVGGATASASGTGLAGLGDRIAALDGELTISSPPGRGTTLHAEVPLGRDPTPRAARQSSAARAG